MFIYIFDLGQVNISLKLVVTIHDIIFIQIFGEYVYLYIILHTYLHND